MIHLERVTKRFGRQTAVDRLTLEVPRGELLVLLGPNGAGKTTTIKLVAGLLAPTEGRVRVGGADLRVSPLAARKALAYVPDQPHLYDKLSGREFLRLVAQIHGLPAERIAAVTAREAERFGVQEFQDELTETYSHGMKQRVVLASAFQLDTPVILVDEPLVGLDPRSARVAKNALVSAAREGRTVLVSTHTLGAAEELADRIAILHRGQLIALDRPEAILRGGDRSGTLEDVFLTLTAEAGTDE